MFCIDICNKQPLGEVLHSVEICFVTSLLKESHQYFRIKFPDLSKVILKNSLIPKVLQKPAQTCPGDTYYYKLS